eukprot:5175883-Lingulodinium_polyedra.AAC.1
MHGPARDLCRGRTLREVLRWVRDGKVWCLWLGTPCGRWSVANTTGARGSARDQAGLACAR